MTDQACAPKPPLDDWPPGPDLPQEVECDNCHMLRRRAELTKAPYSLQRICHFCYAVDLRQAIERALPFEAGEPIPQRVARHAAYELQYKYRDLSQSLRELVRQERANIKAGGRHPDAIVDAFERLLEM